MLIVVESLAMCFLMLLVCVVAIANGPHEAAFLYEKDVQKRVVELGLISEERLKKRGAVSLTALLIPILFFVPLAVFFINGARGFKQSFIQICIILMIYGLFDRLFIDWFWVSRSKAWFIPGTEDLMPYVPKKVLIGKWILTIIGYPAVAALLAWVLSFFG